MPIQNRDFRFSRRASAYDNGFEGRFSRRFYRLPEREVALKPGLALLDVGCGTGTLLKMLRDACDFAGYGIDIEEAMASQAKSRCPDMQILCSRSEATPFPDASFDAILACMACHRFSDKPGFSREAARLPKPAGILYIADPRFPRHARKALNALLRRLGIVGEFLGFEETLERFSPFSFSPAGYAHDGYAQVVALRRTGGEETREKPGFGEESA